MSLNKSKMEMTKPDEFQIRLEDSFQTLSRAPIVEAVIQIKSRAETSWEESGINDEIKSALPEYVKRASMNPVRQEFLFTVGKAEGKTTPPSQRFEELGWSGIKCATEDEGRTAVFSRDQFTFNQTSKYLGWKKFYAEAIRLWKIHQRLASPTEIGRVGMRFINRIGVPKTGFELNEYLAHGPSMPNELPLDFTGFLYRDTLAVPGGIYAMNLVRTIQGADEKNPEESGLIVDIDVFTIQSFTNDEAILKQRLAEMRWLKNKAFFGIVSESKVASWK